MLALVEDLTVLRLYIRLASPAIADGTFNSAVQARPMFWACGIMVETRREK